MKVFDSLPSSFINRNTVEDPQLTSQSLCTSEFSVFKLLASLNSNKASGPDDIPAWIKENADILASPVSDILNLSYKEARLLSIWKHADIIPIPKDKPVREVNKHLRPISLTPIISKIAEDFIVEDFDKPAVLQRIDPNQFGTIPKSNPTYVLLSMLHSWNDSTDRNGAPNDLIDHGLLVAKLHTYNLPHRVINWIIDFLTCRKQRVKLNQEDYSDWAKIPPEFHRVRNWTHGYILK
jgi:hypothetical protein